MQGAITVIASFAENTPKKTLRYQSNALRSPMPVYEVIKNNKTGKHDSFFKQFIRDLSVRSVLIACAILSVCLFAFSIDFVFICRSWDKK